MYSWTHDGSQWVNICVIFTITWLLWSYNLILIRCGAKGIVWSGLIFDSSKAFDRIVVLLFSDIRCGGHGAFLWPVVLVLCGRTKVTGIWFNASSLKDASNEDVDQRHGAFVEMEVCECRFQRSACSCEPNWQVWVLKHVTNFCLELWRLISAWLLWYIN